ncbi:G-protein coupled receptor family C group 6 member A [Xenopus laevis]|uniref:G-protein coupled receptors family 3 profile domain-containing protein n=2 Tax=Xenopus laevis TaxID=8355 RepID=A0A974HJN4_XENLA|nr:G-protein coupled receptor family C group 6 member A [Xenopus laevis]OCT80313.1 hypothetical protein XELAEV_18027132mg [Xenopus laevis]
MMNIVNCFLIFHFCHLLTTVLSCDIHKNSVAWQPGDIVIGGIFPIHNGILNVSDRKYVSDFNCTNLQLGVMNEVLSMIYTIEQINNSTLLPGITLGYEIYDSCSNALKAVQTTLQLIPESADNSDTCINDALPTIKAVVGDKYSEISVAISRILSTHFVPQISPASSASTLSDKVRFPSFLRTVPSDIYQTEAIAKMIKAFAWNWIGIITNDDDYGRSALESLNTLFKQEGICIGFSKTLPSYVGHVNLPSELENVLDELNKSTSNVVVVFVKGPIVRELFIKAIEVNISKTWIASDSWSYSNEVSSIKNIERVGTILGINFKAGKVPGFSDYVRNLQPPLPELRNDFIKEYKELRFGCTEEYRKYLECKASSKYCFPSDSVLSKSPLACTVENVYTANDDYLVKNIEMNKIYSTSLAITAIGQALRNIVCKNGTCEDFKNLTPLQLLNELKKGSYSYNNESFHFDSFGDAMTGYDIINWKVDKNSKKFQIVGKYDIMDSAIKLNRDLFQWNTLNNQVPFSNCSTLCSPGYYKKHSFISCCYQCLLCVEQYYSPEADMNECLKCPSRQWSKNGSSRCENKTIEYFQWSNPIAIVLLIFDSFIFLLVFITGAVFFKYADTPTVKAAGGKYTYLLQISLLLSMITIGFFIGQPNKFICQIRQPLYGISFTISVSCILMKSIRILLAFESAKKNKLIMKLTYQPAVIICVLTVGQLCLCILWHVLKSPFVEEIDNVHSFVIQCNEGSYVAFAVMLGYIGILAFICFVLAYKGRNLPKRYNEARRITFSMLIYMFVWIIFIPIYLKSDDMYLSAVQALAILASVYGMVFCHLLPALYIILFKRKTNSREMYLQSISAFHRTTKRVLSLYINKSVTNVTSGGTDTKINTVSRQFSSGSTLKLRKRHKSY